MFSIGKVARIAFVTLALLSVVGAGVAVTHVPTITIADGSSGTIDAG